MTLRSRGLETSGSLCRGHLPSGAVKSVSLHVPRFPSVGFLPTLPREQSWRRESCSARAVSSAVGLPAQAAATGLFRLISPALGWHSDRKELVPSASLPFTASVSAELSETESGCGVRAWPWPWLLCVLASGVWERGRRKEREKRRKRNSYPQKNQVEQACKS